MVLTNQDKSSLVNLVYNPAVSQLFLYPEHMQFIDYCFIAMLTTLIYYTLVQQMVCNACIHSHAVPQHCVYDRYYIYLTGVLNLMDE